MSATVHRLFPDNGNKPHSSSAPGAVSPIAENPLIETLRKAVTPILLKQLRTMFEGADDALFGMSQRAAAQEDHRSSFDIMRLLRLERRNIELEFGRLIGASFHASSDMPLEEFDLDRLSIAPTEELEERIAVGNLVTKSENLHQPALKELSARVTHMIRDLGIPISRLALTPNVVCNAFKTSIATLDLPLPVRLLLYKLFDRSCAARLNEPLDMALKVLDTHQIKVPEPEKSATAGWSPYGPPPTQVESEERLEPPTLDSTTRGALREIGSVVGGYRPQDAEFAEELLSFADVEEERPSVARVAPAQRMSLVGQMCNEILSDPHLPPTMRPLFERLRFPLIKIALADGTFFSNRVHPVRRLVAEAAETASSSRVATPAVVRRLEERLRHIAEQIDLSATFVRPQLSHLLPLTMPEIASFLDQQREESETRRENVLNKVRRTVAQELEIHTLGRKPPTPLVNFLRMGWGPLMAARLLRHGMNSRSWIDAINRLVQILSSLDVIDSVDQAARRAEIFEAIGAELAEIGMREDKVVVAKGYLEKTYADLDERLAKLTPEEREMQSNELELLTPMETAAVMAEFPAPGSPQSRAPAPGVVRDTVRDTLAREPARDPLLDFVITLPNTPTPPPFGPHPTPPAVVNTPVVEPAPPETPRVPAAPPVEARKPAPTPPAPSPPPPAHAPTVAPPSPPAGRAPDAPPAPTAPPASPPRAEVPSAAPPPRVEIPVVAPTTEPTPAPSPSEQKKVAEPPPPAAPAVETPAPPPVAAAPEPELRQDATDVELLTLCLTAESWFRVFDGSNGQTLWLKVSRYYPEHDTVGFNGFDAKKTLSIRASKFIQDMVAGRSEPVNASPAQQRAMAELRARHKA